MARGGGRSPSPPNPEREVESEDAKATIYKTPVQPIVPEEASLVERQEEGTTMREIGRGATSGLTEETLDTEFSSPVPPDPLPALPRTDAESNKDHEAEGRKSPGSPSRRGIEGRPQGRPTLHLSKTANKHCELPQTQWGEHGVCRVVTQRKCTVPSSAWSCETNTRLCRQYDTQLTPETFTASQHSAAIMDSADNITPQWYIEPLERHVPARH